MIAAVVLAGGTSSRMGANKMLLPWGANTLLESVLDAVEVSCVDVVLVVLGHQHERLLPLLRSRPVRWVVNPHYAEGMLSSVRCGLRAVGASDAFLVVLGDQPGITPALIDALIESFKTNQAEIVVPTRYGRRGHPILFAACFVPQILTHFDNEGLRGLLRSYPERVTEIETSEGDIFTDLDTPEEYQQLKLRLGLPDAFAGRRFRTW